EELQAEAADRAQEPAHKCVQELNELRRDAHSDKAYDAAVAAVMGKAKILNLILDHAPPSNSIDFSSANDRQQLPYLCWGHSVAADGYHAAFLHVHCSLSLAAG